MKAGILYFPGTNCERDLIHILEKYFSISTELLDYRTGIENKHDIYFLPGGFSYGDYLRSGALAARSNAVHSLASIAKTQTPIIGICNGFQILTESGLLPGALHRNRKLKHICQWVPLESDGHWKNKLPENWALPVSHSEGNFICDKQTLSNLQENNQILLRYKEDINGSTDNIAGICSQNKKIIGLMPHPERAITPSLDVQYSPQQYGKNFFELILNKTF